jgi:hypothetical protein
LKRGTNKDIGPKDIFEIASNKIMILFKEKIFLNWVFSIHNDESQPIKTGEFFSHPHRTISDKTLRLAVAL